MLVDLINCAQERKSDDLYLFVGIKFNSSKECKPNRMDKNQEKMKIAFPDSLKEYLYFNTNVLKLKGCQDCTTDTQSRSPSNQPHHKLFCDYNSLSQHGHTFSNMQTKQQTVLKFQCE